MACEVISLGVGLIEGANKWWTVGVIGVLDFCVCIVMGCMLEFGCWLLLGGGTWLAGGTSVDNCVGDAKLCGSGAREAWGSWSVEMPFEEAASLASAETAAARTVV